jgi:hypothetical protein
MALRRVRNGINGSVLMNIPCENHKRHPNCLLQMASLNYYHVCNPCFAYTWFITTTILLCTI